MAGERLLFGVDAPVTDKLGGDPEGLATLQALIAFGLCVNAAVILQCHQIGELLLADRAEEGSGLVTVLVVEQRTSVAICTPTMLTDVTLLLRTVSFTAFLLVLGLWEPVYSAEGRLDLWKALNFYMLVQCGVPAQILLHLHTLLIM